MRTIHFINDPGQELAPLNQHLETAMLKLFFRSTLRLIARNRTLSYIKIVGLSLGIATFLLLTLFSFNEFHYDRQHPHHERLQRFIHRVNTPEGMQSYAFASATIGPALKERYPEVEAYTRFLQGQVSVRNPANDAGYGEKKFAFVDQNFLELFRFPLKSGSDPAQILSQPYSVILTPSTAAKYFGDDDPVGKSLVVNGKMECIVKGVFQSDPSLTHFVFDFMASMATLEAIKNDPQLSFQIPAARNIETKGYAAFYTYLLMAPGASPAALEAKFPAFIEEFRGKGRSERLKPILQSVDSIHLQSALLYELDQNGTAQGVYVFFLIGSLILLIACVNYINTSTAEFVNRSRGTALKKILGISRTSLLASHLTETAVLTFLALLLGSLVAFLLLPEFNTLLARKIEFFTPAFFITLALIFLVTTIASGLYPAWAITSMQTLESFRGSAMQKPSFFSLRNALVSLQIFISFGLISIAILIYFQIDFLLSTSLGFDSGQVLVVNARSMTVDQRSVLKTLITQNRQVLSLGACSIPPGENLTSYGIALPQHSSDEEQRIATYQSYVDAGYLQALGVEIEDGRYFDPSNGADSISYLVINKALASIISDSVMNRDVLVPDIFSNTRNRKSIIGVFNNFHFASLHKEVEPLILEYNPNRAGALLVRFEPKSAAEIVAAVQKAWKQTDPSLPIDYYFLDDGFAKLYAGEQKQKSMASLAAALAIGLAALGIFGAMLFWVQQKTREISIRKVMGSERTDLFVLMFRPVALLILTSCLACVPVVWSAGTKWLEQYPYRIGLSSFYFVGSFALILTVVVTTLLYHFIKIIHINPAQVLKNN